MLWADLSIERIMIEGESELLNQGTVTQKQWLSYSQAGHQATLILQAPGSAWKDVLTLLKEYERDYEGTEIWRAATSGDNQSTNYSIKQVTVIKLTGYKFVLTPFRLQGLQVRQGWSGLSLAKPPWYCYRCPHNHPLQRIQASTITSLLLQSSQQFQKHSTQLKHNWWHLCSASLANQNTPPQFYLSACQANITKVVIMLVLDVSPQICQTFEWLKVSPFPIALKNRVCIAAKCPDTTEVLQTLLCLWQVIELELKESSAMGNSQIKTRHKVMTIMKEK